MPQLIQMQLRVITHKHSEVTLAVRIDPGGDSRLQRHSCL